MKEKQQKEPAQLTVAELMKTSGVPLPVWMWLERFADGDKHALQPFGNNDDPAVVRMARLVYDVLDSKHKETGVGLSERQFPEEARDFVEEWLYHLSNYFEQHVWSDATLAITALPNMVNIDGLVMSPEGDATHLLLRSAVERLTTRRERRAFLCDADEGEDEKESDINWRAAFKLSRVLADPLTDKAAWWHLRDVLTDFSMELELDITHPALARRAFLLLCEAKPKGRVRECRRLRKRVLDALDAIPEEKGGAS